MIFDPITKTFEIHTTFLLINVVFLENTFGKSFYKLVYTCGLDLDVGLSNFHIKSSTPFVTSFVHFI